MRYLLALLLLASPALAHPKKQSKGSSIVIHEYSVYLDGSACKRAWGEHGTPDIPWTLVKGHTWLDCFDEVKHLDFGPPKEKYDYLRWSIMEDFMKMPKLGTGENK